MFAPPQNVHATVFARLPDTLRMRGRHSAWAFGKNGGPHLHSFLEGPVFDRAGNFFVCDIPFGRIMRVSPAGEFSVVTEYDGEPNGLAFHHDGRLFVADHRRGILTVDVASGRVEAFLERVCREGFKGVNDLTFASNGDLYFTDQGQTGLQDPTGRVYRVTAAGRIECLIGNVPSPNGLVLDREERRLLLSVTRANQIWSLPLHPENTTSKVGVFLQLQGGLAGPDGLALDAEGGLVVAHCGMGCVWVFDQLGEPRYRIRVQTGLSTTNVAFAPDGRPELYITEADTGTVYRALLPVGGMPLFSHREPAGRPAAARRGAKR